MAITHHSHQMELPMQMVFRRPFQGRLKLQYIDPMNNRSKVRPVLWALLALHLLTVVYLIFTIPSIPTLFAEKDWVLPQLQKYKDQGNLDEFFRSATRA